MADEFKLPIAVFFFPEPPNVPPIRESFRTLPDTEFDQIPRQIGALLRKAKALQLNLAELSDSRNPARRLITRDLAFPEDVSIAEMAARVRDYLGVSLDQQFALPDDDTALKKWRDALQDAGVDDRRLGSVWADTRQPSTAPTDTQRLPQRLSRSDQS